MPAFGASSTPDFGSSVFCQKPAFGCFGSSPSQTSPFGSAIQPPQPTFGSNSQQPQPAFGSSIFDSSTHFCASSQPAFGSMSTPAFGATSTPSFGATTFTNFESTQPSQLAFGSSIFGYSTPFGGSSQPTFGSTGTPAFGATSTPAFGATDTLSFGSTFGSTGSAVGMSSAPVFES